jgi:hypothetical protein
MNVFACHLVMLSRRAVRRSLPQAIAAVALFSATAGFSEFESWRPQ